jgi:hypothetical protein
MVVTGTGFTVNATAPLTPPLVVTVTLVAPVAAPAPILNVAVICVALTTVTPLTVIPLLVVETVAPETKLVPVSVAPTLLFCTPLDGLTDVSVGGGGVMVTDLEPEFPLVTPCAASSACAVT